MDIHKYLRELYLEKKTLDKAIAALEAKAYRSAPPGRRGRKSMSPEERQEVSRRMSSYWAAKRAASIVPAEPSGSGTDRLSPKPPEAAESVTIAAASA